MSLARTWGPLRSQTSVCNCHATSLEPGERAAMGKPWPALFQPGGVTRGRYNTLIWNTDFYTDPCFLSWHKATALLSRYVPFSSWCLLSISRAFPDPWENGSSSSVKKVHAFGDDMLAAAGATPGSLSPYGHGGMTPPCVLCLTPILWSSESRTFCFQFSN